MVGFYVNMPIMLKHQQFKPKTNASFENKYSCGLTSPETVRVYLAVLDGFDVAITRMSFQLNF